MIDSPSRNRPRGREAETLAQLAAEIMGAALVRDMATLERPVKQPLHDAHVKRYRSRVGRDGRPAKVVIDFHAVDDDHYDIDRRLRNWGTWCNSKSAPSSAPMFKLALPTARARAAYGSATPTPVDLADARKVATGVTALPAPHAAAVHWCYVKPVNPTKACRDIGTTMEGLAQLLHDGRQMLINRGI